jgi:DNA-directed RNA polymerase subunit alpha
LNTLRPYDEVLTEYDILKAENNSLKRQIIALQAELQTCTSFNEEVIEQITDEDYHYHELFHTKLEDLHLSTRTLKSLQSADINKIGELVQYNKSELLKLRNFGKKSLTEIEDLIEDMGLTFGMYDKVSKIEKKFMMKSVE